MEASFVIRLEKNDRVLFLTKDLGLIEQQLYGGLNLLMQDIKPKDLLDDINTDIMTPAWVCFHHRPEDIAHRAYAGLMRNGQRVFKDGALLQGKFKAIVSGERKGVGSSRETAAQCERYSGIRLVFAASFAPIHWRNNINLGQIMGTYSDLIRLQRGETITLDDLLAPFDEFSQKIVKAGGLFNFLKGFTHSSDNAAKEERHDAPMTMAQKIMAQKINLAARDALIQYQPFIAHVDAGYSHEFTSAQVHSFLENEFGADYTICNEERFAAFEDHLIYAEYLPKYSPFLKEIQELRHLQRIFIKKNNLRDFSSMDGISPGICHEVARQDIILPGDFVQATDSHTCMGGALNALAFGVGATEYAGVLSTGLSVVELPPSIRFDLVGRLKNNCTAKDVMLYILLHFTKNGTTFNKIMEFGGEGLSSFSLDERATLCNMATECGAKTGICEPDDALVTWLLAQRPEINEAALRARLSLPDANCHYDFRHTLNLDLIEPMVAHPGDPDNGWPSDPTNGELVKNLGDIPIDIAYGGSCTAGKFDDIDMYAKVTKQALAQGKTLPKQVQFFIQYGSKKVAEYASTAGYTKVFKRAGIEVIPPGCGACIGCGPGVSEHKEQITVSAINRNYQGRSGPGKLYLASPLTVAASAFAGKIVAFQASSL